MVFSIRDFMLIRFKKMHGRYHGKTGWRMQAADKSALKSAAVCFRFKA
jgi:hypothetical protein